MTETPLLYDAFISYARADGRELAERLYTALQKQRLRPWRDERDLNPYQDFSVGIERAIRASKYVVVLLTKSVAEREDSFVRREILEAQARRKPIIPLIGADFDPDDVPVSIKHLTWLPFADVDAGVTDLLERLSETPASYSPPPPSDDPFQDYVEQLRNFVTRELGTSLLNIHDLLLLSAKDSPDAVAAKLPAQPPVLPAAFKSRAFRANEPTPEPSTPPPASEPFDNFNDGFIAHKGRALLLGEPGAGKTTTLLAFTREKANARLANPAALLPIYAPLSTWDGKAEITDWLASAAGLDSLALRREIQANRVLLILDGLDEMNADFFDPKKLNDEPRDFRLELLIVLKSLHTAVLITCRIKDYDDIVKKGGEKIALNGAITLQPLADFQIETYLKDQPELWQAVQTDTALLDMARTPLLLTLLAIGYRDSTVEERAKLRDLNTSPGDLRDRIFATYIRKRYEHEESKIGKLPLTRYELYEGLGAAVVFQLSGWSGDKIYLRKTKNQHLVISLAESLNILQPFDRHKGVWGFFHLLMRNHFGFPYAAFYIKHNDPHIRFNAARTLEQLGNVRAIKLLISAVLRDEDADVRRAAAKALGKLDDSRVVLPLIEALKDADAAVCKAAVNALKQWLDIRAIGLYIIAIKSNDIYIRKVATNVLVQFGDPHIVEPLITILNDVDTYIGQSTAESPGELDDVRAIQLLIMTLNDVNECIRGVAAESLGALGDVRAVEHLIMTLNDVSEFVRRSAVEALGRLHDDRAILPLIAALNDSASNVRKAAAHVLAPLRESVILALKPMTAHPNADTRKLAAYVLESIKIDHYTDEDFMFFALREAAAAGIIHLLDFPSVEQLIIALTDTNVDIREAAAEGLGQLGDVRAVEPLIAALADADWDVRSVAASALGKLRDARAIQALITILNDDDAWVSESAGEALQKIGTPEALAAVEAWRREQDDKRRKPSS